MKWKAEIEIADCWVADGFNLTADRLHEMIMDDLVYANGDEIKVKIISAPADDAILKAQGYHPRNMAEHQKREVLGY